MVQDVPPDFVGRPAEFDALLHLLVSEDRDEPVAITAALRGAGGYGKTTLARALCHDERIQDAFDDGILWVTLGEKPDDLIGRISDLIKMISGEDANFRTVDAASTRLAELFADRDFLLVIDDVWNAADVKPFLIGGKRCARLITTRDNAVLPPGTKHVPVNAMRQSEAVALLGSGLTTEEHREALENIASRLGEWPLLLKLVNKALRDRVAFHHQPTEAALGWVNRALERKGLTAFDVHDPKERSQAVARTLGVSLELLTSQEVIRFRELAIFPEDVAVPVSVVEKLWAATGTLDDFDTEQLCERLANLSLLLEFNLDRRTLQLHDVVRLYLVEVSADAIAHWHAAFLDAQRPSGGWSAMPEDTQPYFWHHLGHHLIGAGRGEELTAIVRNPVYLARKTWFTKSPFVEKDFAAARGVTDEDASVSMMQRYYVQASHILNACETAREVIITLRSRLPISAPFSDSLVKLDEHIQRPYVRPLVDFPDLPDPALVRTFPEFGGRIFDASFSPDGSQILSAGDGAAKLWDTKTGVLIRSFDFPERIVSSAVFSPNGQLIAVGGDDGLFLYEARSGELKRVFGTYNDTRAKERRGISCVSFSPEGLRLFSASVLGAMEIWDVRTGRRLVSCGYVGSVAHTAEFSPDGRSVLSCFNDGTVKVWEAESGSLKHCLKAGDTWIVFATFSPDGKTVASEHGHGFALWDLESEQIIRRYDGHAFDVFYCAFHPDGRQIISASGDSTLKLWDITSGEVLRSYGHQNGRVLTVGFDPSGNLFVSGGDDGALKLWDRRTRRTHVLPDFVKDPREKGVTRVISSRDGSRILCCRSRFGRGGFVVCDSDTGRITRNFEAHEGWTLDADFSPDGTMIVAARFPRGGFNLWDSQSERLINQFDGLGTKDSPGAGCTVAFSPDGSMIAYGDQAGNLALFDVGSWEVRNHVTVSDSIHLVRFTPDSRCIVFTGNDYFKSWNVSTGDQMDLWHAHRDTVSTVTFDCKNQRMVSASADATIKIWTVRDWRIRRTLVGHREEVSSAALNEKYELIVSTSYDGSLRLWDSNTGDCLCVLRVDGPLYSCDFVSDSDRVIAGGPAGLYLLRVIL